MESSSHTEKQPQEARRGFENFAYLQVTRRCNQDCIFCSNPYIERDLDREMATRLLDSFQKEGKTHVLLTGGEPTESPLLGWLIREINKRGMRAKLITNGVNLSRPEIIETLVEAGINSVHVSIHGHKPEIQDYLSQRPGNWEKTIRGIRLALDAGIHVTINSTLNSVNAPHLPSYARFFIENFPEIGHFVFNNLDMGMPGEKHRNKAWENKWIVARLKDLELPLYLMTRILEEHGKTYRIERVPLCYMRGFEHYSTETRKIVKQQYTDTFFIEEDFEIRKIDDTHYRWKGSACQHCRLSPICAGIPHRYAELYGDEELYAVFDDPREITRRVLETSETPPRQKPPKIY